MDFTKLRQESEKIRADKARRKALEQEATKILERKCSDIAEYNKKQTDLADVRKELEKPEYKSAVSFEDFAKEWNKYVEGFNKDMSDKLEELSRAKAAMFKTYLELVEMQNEGLHQRNTFWDLATPIAADAEPVDITQLNLAPISSDNEILYITEQAAQDNYSWLKHVMQEHRYEERFNESSLPWEIRNALHGRFQIHGLEG